MLIESIKNQINILLKELNDSEENVSEEQISKLQSFATSVLENPEELSKYDIEEYVKEVYKDNINVNIDNYIKNLNVLKHLIELKNNDENGLFDLTERQIEFIKQICGDTKKFIDDYNLTKEKKDDINYSILKYQKVINNLEQREKLTHDDIEIVKHMIENYGVKEQLNILKEILRYNLSIDKERINSSVKNSTKQKVNIEEVIKKLKEHNPKKEKQYTKTVREYEEEISNNINLSSCDQVIEFLKAKGIFNNFKTVEDLLTILVYGNLESVTAAYNELSEKKLINQKFIFDFPSLWTKQKTKDKKERKKTIQKTGGPSGNGATLKSKAVLMNREDLYKKLEFFKQLGLDPLEDQRRCSKALGTDQDTLENNLKIIRKYNIELTVSSLTASKTAKKCDQLIECDLLNPNFDPSKKNLYRYDILKKSYANMNSSILVSLSLRHIALIQNILEVKKNVPAIPPATALDIIFSTQQHQDKIPRLNGDFRNKFFGYNLNTPENMKKYLEYKGLLMTDKSQIEKYDDMESIISDIDNIEFTQETKESDFIQKLNEKYGTYDENQEYFYIIEGRKISKPKVLRLYEALTKYNRQNQENAFNENDIRLFAITYGTYFKLDTYEAIKEDIKNLQRGGERL